MGWLAGWLAVGDGMGWGGVGWGGGFGDVVEEGAGERLRCREGWWREVAGGGGCVAGEVVAGQAVRLAAQGKGGRRGGGGYVMRWRLSISKGQLATR